MYMPDDPNVIVKFLMTIGGIIFLIIFSQGCVGKTGGVMLGNNEFWDTQHAITREINRPGKIEVIEEMKLKIVRPKSNKK